MDTETNCLYDATVAPHLQDCFFFNEQTLKSELSGDYRSLVLAMMMRPDHFAASEAHRAVKGLGTNDSNLIELICTRTSSEMKAMRVCFLHVLAPGHIARYQFPAFFFPFL